MQQGILLNIVIHYYHLIHYTDVLWLVSFDSSKFEKCRRDASLTQIWNFYY